MSNVLDGREGRRVHEDLAAERAVLGAVLADNTLIANVAEVVHSDDFSSPAHAAIFAAMLKLDSTQRQVDHLTLSEELKVLGHLATVGGPAYLMALDQGVPLAHNAVQYAQDRQGSGAAAAAGRGGPRDRRDGQPGDGRRRGDPRRVRAQAVRPGREPARGRPAGRQRADGADARAARQDEGLGLGRDGPVHRATSTWTCS